jgi:hypothetical protein
MVGGRNRNIHSETPNRRLNRWALLVVDKPVATVQDEMMQFVTLDEVCGLLVAVAFPKCVQAKETAL